MKKEELPPTLIEQTKVVNQWWDDIRSSYAIKENKNCKKQGVLLDPATLDCVPVHYVFNQMMDIGLTQSV
jgi:hypothetical protein